MARKKRTDDSDADGQEHELPEEGTRAARKAASTSGPPAPGRARPGPQAKKAKAGSVTKAVQQGRTTKFFQEMVAELKKVSWPTRPQLLQATAVVIVAVAIIATFLGLADAASEWIVDRVF